MKIAIHKKEGGFTDAWIQYCLKHDIEVKFVDAYKPDIIQQCSDCDGFMWHFHQGDYKDMKCARNILFSLEKGLGLSVFPNVNTCWHFDDKVAQKYLLESIDAPLVPSYVFYTKEEALKWTETTSFPKVFKLKGGAGSSNVKLAHNKKEAVKIINTMFGKGFPVFRPWDIFRENYRKYKLGKSQFHSIFWPFYMCLKKRYPSDLEHYIGRELGYAYFQDFIPNNTFDIRICVIDSKAFAIKRHTRENDFRASGSGIITYNKDEFDLRCVKISMEIGRRLNAQSIAFDYVFDKNNNPLIVEISYGFVPTIYYHCEGYWTEDLEWHAGSNFDFCGWMVESVIKNMK